MTRPIRPAVIVASAIVGLLSPVRVWAASCGSLPSLSGLARPGTTVTAAQVVAAGAFTPPSGRAGNANPIRDLPAFCRVTATLQPSSDSDIKIGWNDPQISPLNSIDYYRSVAAAMGGVDKVDASYRLFMAPGMAHCGGGEGPSDFDTMAPLEQWVEKGQAPGSIVASHSSGGRVDRTRPLCPYPQLSQFSGTGSSDDASNFVCKAPEASVTTR